MDVLKEVIHHMIRRYNSLKRHIVIEEAGLVSLTGPLKVNRYDAIDTYRVYFSGSEEIEERRESSPLTHLLQHFCEVHGA